MQLKSVTLSALLLGCSVLAVAGENVNVIVRFKNPADSMAHQRFATRGAIHQRNLNLVNAHVYTIAASDLALLANDPDVDYIGPDHAIQGAAGARVLPTQPDYGWMTVLGVTSPTSKLAQDGTGVGVAVIDS